MISSCGQALDQLDLVGVVAEDAQRLLARDDLAHERLALGAVGRHAAARSPRGRPASASGAGRSRSRSRPRSPGRSRIWRPGRSPGPPRPSGARRSGACARARRRERLPDRPRYPCWRRRLLCLPSCIYPHPSPGSSAPAPDSASRESGSDRHEKRPVSPKGRRTGVVPPSFRANASECARPLVVADNGADRASLLPVRGSVAGSRVVFTGAMPDRTFNVSRSFWRRSRGYSSRSTPVRVN